MLNFSSIFPKFSKKRIYLDYASITPVDERVLKHVLKISKDYGANPSSLYREGVDAYKELEKSRAKVAKHLDAQPDEIIFTSGGTESNNLAVEGVLKAYLANSTSGTLKTQSAGSIAKPHIISTAIEHPSVREILISYEKAGTCEVTFVSVDEKGIVDLKELKKSLRPETILVSVMYVNNEIGTIQPIHEVSKIVRHYKKELGRPVAGKNAYPYVHTDACQAVLFCPLRVLSLGVDLMTLDSAKFYGPRSVGSLYIKRGTNISPLLIGGSQESDLRAGTENVAGISGFACALDLAIAEQKKEFARMSGLQRHLVDELKKIQGVVFNGSYEKDSYGNPERVPNNVNICFPGMDAEYTVLRLDAKGIAVSSVTSCRSKNEDSSSYVVEELYKNKDNNESIARGSAQDCSKSSLRITFGRFTRKKDIVFVAKVLKKILVG